MTIDARTEEPSPIRVTAQTLMAELSALRTLMLSDAANTVDQFGIAKPAPESIVNLAHYLALRRHDLRPLQRRLMVLGLSSLGRLEGRVLATLEAVMTALAALAGQNDPAAALPETAFFAGEARLAAAADTLLGPAPRHRRCRIMVTLPGTAANDPDMILDLARRGMDKIGRAHV